MFLDQFRRQVEQQPNKIAIHIDSIALSYQQLGEAVDAMAGRLMAEGVRHGTHVAVLLDNDFSYPAVLLAALQRRPCSKQTPACPLSTRRSVGACQT